MKKYITIAAASALAALSFGTPALARTGSTSGGMTAEEHQRTKSGGDMSSYDQMMSDPGMRQRMMAMMERCEEMMSKKGKHTSASSEGSTKRTSADGKWAWRPNPKQAPGPRAPLLAPVRVWVPAKNSPSN